MFYSGSKLTYAISLMGIDIDVEVQCYQLTVQPEVHVCSASHD